MYPVDTILNSLAAHVAVLAPGGQIVLVNEAWNRFARENGIPDPGSVGVAANYVEVCRRSAGAGDADAGIALEGVLDVLGGRSESFQLEYACHSPDEERWFLMNVSVLRAGSGGAVVEHTNITGRRMAELAALARESTVRALLDAASHSIVAVDRDERIVTVNNYTEKMFGYSREEMVGRPLAMLIPRGTPSVTGDQWISFASRQNWPAGTPLELAAVRKDGTSFLTEIGLGAIDSGGARLVVVFVTDLTQRLQMERSARTYAEEIQKLAASLLTAQEEERRRVSRELHDQICQELAALAIELGDFAAEPLPAQDVSRLRALQKRVIHVSEESRHIAYELHPSVLDDLGLVNSLRDLCKQFSRRAKDIAVEFVGVPLPPSLRREAVSCLYRIAQESLSNIAAHAGARQVSVSLKVKSASVVLTIEDDGAGFDPDRAKGSGGLGLIGMEERVRLVRGRLSIDSAPGRGARIRVEVPFEVV